VRTTGSLFQPGGEHGLRRCGERDGAVLAAFALAADVCTGAEHDVGAGERDQLGDAQAGLEREHEHRPVTPAHPSRPVRRVEQRFRFPRGEEGDRPLLEAFGRDREHACDHGRVLGMTERCVAKQ
jgi:hypothetical protein